MMVSFLPVRRCRHAFASAELSTLTLPAARFGFAGAPRQLEAEGGWIVARRVTLSGWARHSRYAGDRTEADQKISALLALAV